MADEPRGPPGSTIPIKRRVESFADDLSTRRGIVSGRVALLPRSTEIQPYVAPIRPSPFFPSPQSRCEVCVRTRHDENTGGCWHGKGGRHHQLRGEARPPTGEYLSKHRRVQLPRLLASAGRQLVDILEKPTWYNGDVLQGKPCGHRGFCGDFFFLIF